LATLLDYCSLVRSKNAGPFTLTFDFMCHDEHTFKALVALDVLDAKLFAEMFHTDVSLVRVIAHPLALAVKVSLPRPTAQGGLDDSDCYAGQQYGPLMALELPGVPPA
jgi:hypothetical protein